MMVSGPTSSDDDEGLLNVIRLEKTSDENVSDLDTQHVVHGGPFHGVVIRRPMNGRVKTLLCYFSNLFLSYHADAAETLYFASVHCTNIVSATRRKIQLDFSEVKHGLLV